MRPAQVLCGFVLLLLAGYLRAETLIAALGADDYAPFYFTDVETGELQGASVDICLTLASSLGYRLEIQRLPFARLLTSLEEGEIDLACNLYITPERQEYAHFVDIPQALDEMYIIRMKDHSAMPPEKPGEHTPDTIGGVRGYYYGPREADNLVLYNDDRQLPLILLNHRVAGVLSNIPTFRLHARRAGLDDDVWVADPEPWFRGPIYMAFSRQRADNAQLVGDFTRAMISYQASPEYQTLLERYGLRRVTD
ncbi:MAG TPA: hypothetical protein DEA26_03180 [Oceanospirillales bacterium]|nr:hypothetical protein [Oceanospirillaceae bacterium]HBS41657.1 hypothetical protein [Oceanospirillales bacterium]|tara:strand:- start:9873 stop:10628 length:756 start_codon:yes stop_codon:yes gene_type:complete